MHLPWRVPKSTRRVLKRRRAIWGGNGREPCLSSRRGVVGVVGGVCLAGALLLPDRRLRRVGFDYVLPIGKGVLLIIYVAAGERDYAVTVAGLLTSYKLRWLNIRNGRGGRSQRVPPHPRLPARGERGHG